MRKATRMVITRNSMTTHLVFDPSFDLLKQLSKCQPGTKINWTATVQKSTASDEQALLMANDGSMTSLNQESCPRDIFRTPTKV